MEYINHHPTSMTEFCGRDENMNLQIHYLEKEAYGYVLRAFIAQSDLLTWGKEGLITELRKELNVTDTEHGELLGKINSDKSIKMIRDWRKGVHCAQESISGKLNAHCFAPNSADDAPPKKVKTSHSSVSISRRHVSHSQPSFGTQAQKYVSRFQPVGTLPSTVPVPSTDDQHGGQLVMFTSGNPEQPMRVVNHSNQAPSDSQRKGLGKCHTKKGFLAPKVKKKSGVIEIRATDKLIHQIEQTIYGTKTPNPAQVEKAKLILKEHERDILHALDKLADVSDGDEPPNQMQRYYPQKEFPGSMQGTAAAQNDFYRQTGWQSRFHQFRAVDKLNSQNGDS
ncbi:hypothetical protein QYF36_007646 [Acer negundo]|nr:hypothetical protein QYF36_007646 [Acer negundo]